MIVLEKLKAVRDKQNIRKEQQIDALNAEDLLTELKNKGLPTFGTNVEKRERLKKHHGISPSGGDST